MRNLKTKIGTGILAFIIGLFFSVNVMANGTSTDGENPKKSKDEVAAEKLAESIVLDKDLMDLELSLEEEGVISCNENLVVRILNADDEVVYEGSYNGFSVEDKELKKYMDKADLLVNAGNVAYYMLF